MTLFILLFVIAIPSGEVTLSGIISAVAAKELPETNAEPTAREMVVNVLDFVFPFALENSLTATHVWVA